jgi:[ribosomal protein S5]-alanine N-acetyltransferase
LILITPRLRLREFTLNDAPFILELLNQPGFLRFIGDRGVRTLDDARAYLANGPLASYASLGFGLWQVELLGTSEPVGMCGLLKRAILPHTDIGYAFLERYSGQGYAFEAAAAVKAHAFGALGLPRLLAVVNPDNDRSIHLLEKLGMRPEGALRLSPKEPEVRLYAC